MLPEKLARDIAEEAVRWDMSLCSTTSSFLDSYTLHDSLWLGLHLDTAWDGDATAIIAFDPMWNKLSVSGVPECSEWPILLIRFPFITSIKLSDYRDIGGVQRGIARAETKGTTDGKVVTTISDHYDDKISIVHRDPVKLLCFVANGERIELNLAQEDAEGH